VKRLAQYSRSHTLYETTSATPSSLRPFAKSFVCERIASRSRAPGVSVDNGYQVPPIRYGVWHLALSDPVRDSYLHTPRFSVMTGIKWIKVHAREACFSDEAVVCAPNISQAFPGLKMQVPPVILRPLSLVLSFTQSLVHSHSF
jgi:hypothetical protein